MMDSNISLILSWFGSVPALAHTASSTEVTADASPGEAENLLNMMHATRPFTIF